MSSATIAFAVLIEKQSKDGIAFQAWMAGSKWRGAASALYAADLFGAEALATAAAQRRMVSVIKIVPVAAVELA